MGREGRLPESCSVLEFSYSCVESQGRGIPGAVVPIAAPREGEMAVERLGLWLLSGERKEEFGDHQRTAVP